MQHKHFSIYALLFFVLSIVFAPASSAQIEVTPMGGYQYGGKLRIYEGQISALDGGNYGVSMAYGFADGIQTELSWTRMDSEIRVRRYGALEIERLFDVATEYFQIGVIKEANDSNTRPYGLLNFGAAIFSPKDVDLGNEWFFSIGLGGGIKTFISEKIGLRLQGRFLMPVRFKGAGLWCGSGGCYTVAGDYAAFLQGDFQAGIIFLIGE